MALLDSSMALFLAFALPKIVTKLGVSFLASCPTGFPWNPHFHQDQANHPQFEKLNQYD